VRRELSAAILFALCVGCGRRAGPAPQEIAGEPAPAENAASTPDETAPPAKILVTVYFPSAAADGLAGEPREIVDTARPADRGAQIVAALLEGPKGKDALPAAPAGTTLRRLWVRDDGTAYADFSDELTKGMSGGTSDEILTVYAIVDSLVLNVPEIKKVGVLVAGHERDTLGGHIDVRRPLVPDRSLLTPPATKE